MTVGEMLSELLEKMDKMEEKVGKELTKKAEEFKPLYGEVR